MVYQHRWSPISYSSIVGLRKFAAGVSPPCHTANNGSSKLLGVWEIKSVHVCCCYWWCILWRWLWRCVLFQLVVGYLHTSRLTGRIQLFDQTGSIDCVLGAWPSTTNESSTAEHCCTSNSCMGSMSSGQVGECPFIQTSLLGGIFRVDRFQLVVERFQVPNCSTAVVCPYILFAATDLLQLCGHPRQKLFPSLSSKSGSQQLHDSENSENQERFTCDSCNISKRSVVAQRVDCQNDSCDDMFASFVGSPKSQVIPDVATADYCQCSVSQLFIIDFCENISLRSQHIEQLSLQFTATGCFVGPPRLSGCGCPKSVGNSIPARLPLVRPVAVLFGSRLVRWYPVLHSGCIYRLTYHSCDVSPFLGKFMLPRTNKTKLERHAARCLIVLDTDVQVKRIIRSSPSYKDLVLSAEEDAAVSAAVDDVHSRLSHSDDFWQQQSQTASVRYAVNWVKLMSL